MNALKCPPTQKRPHKRSPHLNPDSGSAVSWAERRICESSLEPWRRSEFSGTAVTPVDPVNWPWIYLSSTSHRRLIVVGSGEIKGQRCHCPLPLSALCPGGGGGFPLFQAWPAINQAKHISKTSNPSDYFQLNYCEMYYGNGHWKQKPFSADTNVSAQPLKWAASSYRKVFGN